MIATSNMADVTNKIQNTATPTNKELTSGSRTWNEMTDTWADYNDIWANPQEFGNKGVNNASITNKTLNG